MNYIAPRNCTEYSADEISVSKSMEDYRDCSVYVLLGDPGSGKSTAFKDEAAHSGCGYVTARDLITFDNRPEWIGKTLFIDGLDEIRAGAHDARTPFDVIRKRIAKLNPIKFRLSCREADWYGASDENALEKVSIDGKIRVLHLEPLSEKDVVTILERNYQNQVASPREFIDEADKRGLKDLTRNPQILDMLVTAIGDNGKWPETRLETFELACRKLVTEHNREHIDAQRNTTEVVEERLLVAGFLCSLLLISGKAGFGLTATGNLESYPWLGELSSDNHSLLRLVAKTKLFSVHNDQAIYRHRSIAEFLAARYLAVQIEKKGLPVGRVLALLAGVDGTVVSELRGLFAWLAVLCQTERSQLISRDPLGIVLYGDVRLFSTKDKTHILKSLKGEAEKYEFFKVSLWIDSPFGALGTKDMEPCFTEILDSHDRDPAHQALAEIVVDALFHGERLSGLTNRLDEIIRDPDWWPRIRHQALKVWVRELSCSPKSGQKIRRLFEDIEKGIVSDPDDEIMGALLKEYYPKIILPSEVFNYLRPPKDRDTHVIGRYHFFWHRDITDQSSDQAIKELLDDLTIRGDHLRVDAKNRRFDSMIFKLLARGLNAFGETEDTATLVAWLSLGLSKRGYFHLQYKKNLDEVKLCQEWIASHPEQQKAIIEFNVARCLDHEDFTLCANKAKAVLFDAALANNHAEWCLAKASSVQSEQEAKYYFKEAVRTLFIPNNNVSIDLETIQHAAESQPKFAPWLEEMLVWPLDQDLMEEGRSQHKYVKKEKEENRRRLEDVRLNRQLISEGKASHAFMHELAAVYYSSPTGMPEGPAYERLSEHLNNEDDLVQAALLGFRKTLDREDLPDAMEIYKSSATNRSYLISQPFLAGLDEISKASAANILTLNHKTLRTGVAFYLADCPGTNPVWIEPLMQNRPELIAELLVDYARVVIKAGEEFVDSLHSLAYEKSWSEIAKLAAMPLLISFPARCTNRQLRSLRHLLYAGLKLADRGELEKLIKKKVALRSMNVAQRVYWLTAGFLLDAKGYKDLVVETIQSNESRVKYMAVFLSERGDRFLFDNQNDSSAISLLVQILGTFYSTYKLEGSGYVTPIMEASDLIGFLIQKLAAIPDEYSTKELDRLRSLDQLSSWHIRLRAASYQQDINKREVLFQHPSVQQTNDTLRNLAPASAADLAALTLDHFQEMAKTIHVGNTDDYKQYWNLDTYGRPVTRRHEDVCRDTFLSSLRQRFALLGIDAQPEGHYASDKRSDIRVSYGSTKGFNVPVEIKCNDHQQLWRAIHNQLIAKYTRDPGACGHGIYLVFWFGSHLTTPAPKGSGSSPKTPEELEGRLRNQLSKSERQLISVCVVDCSYTNHSRRPSHEWQGSAQQPHPTKPG